MRSTGIVRQIDELGRLVLPKELRRKLNIRDKDKVTGEGDSVEIFVDGEDVILRKYKPGCVFCKEGNDLTDYMGSKVCKKCISKLNK